MSNEQNRNTQNSNRGGGISSEFKLFNRRRIMQVVDHPQKNNEIWYTTTNHKKLANREFCPDGGTLLYHYYDVSKDRGVIGYSKDLNGKLWFRGLTTLKTVTLPDTFTTLINKNERSGASVNQKDEGACFGRCTNLTHVYSPSITKLSYGCFMYTKVSSVQYDAVKKNQTKSVNLSSNIAEINEYAFYWCSYLNGLSAMNNLPNSVTSIKINSFAGTGGFGINAVLVLKEGLTSWRAPIHASDVKSISFPSTITNISELGILYKNQEIISNSENFPIDNYCLYNKTKTKLIGIPGSNPNLINLVIPDTVTSIDAYCGALVTQRTLTFGYRVTSLPAYSIYCHGDSGKLTVYIRRTISIITSGAGNQLNQSNNHMTSKIYVPDHLVDTYKTATYWSKVPNKIVGYNPFSTACYEILTDATTGYATNSTQFQKIWVCGLDNPVTSQYPNGALAELENCNNANDMYTIAVNCGY